MKMKLALANVVFLLVMTTSFAAEKSKVVPAQPTSHTTKQIEGWTVRVDDRLLNGEHADLGERALKLLSSRLYSIAMVVSEKQLAGLRKINIELDYTYGDLRFMQYHPDAGWLKKNGYSEKLAKCVHIPDVADFLSPFENHRMPWVILHELSHGYHDQILGFDDPRVIAVYKKYAESGHGKNVLTINGNKQDHYALTNEKEFFAEMTECYFGTNDFYPFVVGELRQSEPEIYNLMKEIWGPLPAR